VAEKTGLLGAALKAFALIVPRLLLTPAIVFLGIMSSLATDAGYVVLPPLAAALYISVGRSPLVGIAAAFAGVSAGFNANLLITGLDPMLASMSSQAAQVIDADYVVAPTANWWFMIGSTFVITLTGWFTTALFVSPRLSRKPAEEGGPQPRSTEPSGVTPREAAGLGWAALVHGLLLGGLIVLAVLPGSPLYGNSPTPPYFARWVAVVVPLIFLLFMAPGIAYGVRLGVIRTASEVPKLMVHAIAGMAPIIVLAFFAAQFIAYFNWTNLGIITAVSGAELIQHLGLQDWPIPLMVALVAFAAVVNLIISSASAKWALLAPVFVPMFMLLGYSPELVQGAFRVGDSVTNIITPLMSYFPLILTFAQRYEPRAGIGTMVATMLPYSFAFMAAWVVLLVIWIGLGLPMGPGAPLRLTP
jgi:aminobenzoyl-glutamate transport protein